MTTQHNSCESYEEWTVRYNAWLEAVWYETKGVPEFVFEAWQASQEAQAEYVVMLELNNKFKDDRIEQLQLDLSTELKRVSSYKTLAESLEGQLSHYSDKDYKLSERRLNGLEQSLISEQQMNETLTNENAQLQLDNARMRDFIKDYCIGTAGGMVNGNILNERAIEALGESKND